MYEKFKRSGKKPSDFCKVDLKMSDVKSYEFVKNYFSNPDNLVSAIQKYRRVEQNLDQFFISILLSSSSNYLVTMTTL